MKLIQCLVLALLVLALPPAVTADSWDLPTAYPDSNFHTVNIKQFAAEVEKATAGKVKITVHPNASLFKMTEIKRAVQTGQVQIGEIILSSLENESPLMGLDSIPFLATGYPESRKLWKVSRAEVEQYFAKQGLKVLFSVPWPPQGLYVKKQLDSTADMKGLKLRSYNPAISRIAELVGAQPVTIQAAELAQAMATGAVNANITSSATGVDTKIWEYMTHFYDIKAWLPKNVILVNQKVFDGLDNQTRETVLKLAAQAEERGWKASEAKTKEFVATLSGKMKVLPPGPRLKADLDKIGATMTDEWIRKYPAGKSIIGAYRKK